MKKHKKTYKKKNHSTKRKKLRSGSKEVKRILLQNSGVCDICGSRKNLQLHHIYLIRHGFPTELTHCCLLCPSCHREFHIRWDKYLDVVFKEDPQADFLKIYEILKKL